MGAQDKQPADRLWVALHDRKALIRVENRGSYKISTALKQFGEAALKAGCHVFVLDMAACIGMDSTFMGVLAGLAFRARKQPDGVVILINLSARTRGLLATLGLDEVVQPHMAGSTPEVLAALLGGGAELTEAGKAEVSRTTATETAVEAHENLIRLSAENLPKFKDVLSFLREDLKQNGSNPERD